MWQILRRRSAQVELCWWRPANGTINFGDALSPVIVDAMLARRKLSRDSAALRRKRLLAIGSCLHFARTGDVIWGAGINGKIAEGRHRFRDLDVRAVRGPLTAQFLRKRGISVPEVYGDPALLLPYVMPWEAVEQDEPYIVMPNLNDLAELGVVEHLVSPLSPWADCIARIRTSRLVIASSLHALIAAEAFGIPARALRLSDVEAPFKYRDYLLATGRPELVFARSVDEALEMGGMPPPQFDPAPLLQAFPYDLWGADLSA
ncbi:MAG: polysaccharide pyruvyl transferase family protein [Formivibrio sp.]|nr:polysaccharide pyruvyl transferase family protein [Formivibrio sp.]